MYMKDSTANPLGRRPWNAMLQPGGLGAFFPNAEAAGFNSVMLDRDAANPGWKPWGAGLNSAPRGYYPPDARTQYTTPRGQGLGATTPLMTSLSEIWARRGLPGAIFSTPHTFPVGPVSVVNTAQPAPVVRNAPPALPPIVANPTPPVPIPRNYLPGIAPVAGTPAPSAPATQPNASSGIVQATTQGGTTVSVATSPVPASQPTGTPFVNNDGSIWVYATASGTWTQAVPAGASTANTYTDANGNVWSWTATGWAMSGVAGVTSGVTSWLTSSSIVSGVPNYLLAAGAGFLAVMMMKGKR